MQANRSFVSGNEKFSYHEMDRGSKGSGVKRITIHDLRHSHISLLIDAGFTAVDIANRLDMKVFVLLIIIAICSQVSRLQWQRD